MPGFIGLLQLSVMNRADERTQISQSNHETMLPARLIQPKSVHTI